MLEIDANNLKRLDVLLTVVTTMAALVYGWLLLKFRGEFASAKELASLRLQVESLAARTATLDGAIGHLPTREDTHSLALSLADMRGDMRGVAARLDGIEKVISATGRRVELIDEHLKAAG